tara:strand:+ start:826 stop:999 length:174 start_codon:yes stop_codon:yes gene_type:complete
MNITSVKYQPSFTDENEAVQATIEGNVLFIPMDTKNRHWQAIQKWAEEDGNEIQEAD